MQKRISLCLFCFMAIAIMAQNSTSTKENFVKLSSPNGNQTIKVYQKQENDSVRSIYYNVTYKNLSVIEDSKMGLELDNRIWELALARKIRRGHLWMDNLVVDSIHTSEHKGSWHNSYGERSSVQDNYHSAIIYMSKKDDSQYRMDIELRAYNEGVAFRFYFPEHPTAFYHKIVKDLTEYTFAPNTYVWSAEWAQAPYQRLEVNQVKEPAERALTVELPNGLWAALTDADTDDWCLTKYQTAEEKKNTLTSVMYSSVDLVTYAYSPWKVIMAAETPGKLLEQNDIVLNLNPENEIKDFSWVKPGKIMRTGISTEAALETIDFCATHNLQYILFDCKWYWPCLSHDGDATKIVNDLDLEKVAQHAKEKGIGIWMYVNQHALAKQAREVFPMLRKYGVVGVKFGFVEFASHRWATWLHYMVRLAAENHLMVNIHDEYRPSGFSRTYPNLLTQEGIRGNEEWPDATHNTNLVFTRMINGPADYTICYYDPRLKNTHGHQMAASIIFFSPLETLFWYDGPSRSNKEPELEWFENLQTTFDDTKVLSGAPGKNAIIARKKGNEWFVGAMTNNEGSSETIPLSFLDAKQTYLARIYTDGGEAIKTKTQIKCTYLKVDSKQTLNFKLQPRGGAAIQLIPLSKQEAKKYEKYAGERL